MKRHLAALFLSLFVITSPVMAQDGFKPDKGYKSLFNGKDLTGWFLKGKEKDDLTGKTATSNKRFTVEGGVIVVNPGGGGGLYTVENFNSDFHLRLEFRAAPRADSGVFIRGPQLQVRDYPTVGPYRNLKDFKKGGWNVLDITVTGKTALCKCNGEVIETKAKAGAKGGIGLQAESGKFEYRHIQIKVAAAVKPSGDPVGSPRSPTGFQQEGAKKKRLLLITESRGYVHSVVNRGKKAMCLVERTFVELSKNNPFFEVEYSQDSRAAITGENLKNFDAVFFYTTGELPLTDSQKSDLLAFVRNGKGFGGSHCATDTFYRWKEYGELIGGYFDGHPWHQKIRVIVEDKKHAATKHLGDSFEITDEIYQFKAPYGRDKLHVLMRLDMDSVQNPGKRADKDNALAWTHAYGKGRVFYTALGHREQVWNDPRFQQHVIGGLRYMFGIAK
ncbi:MAG: ThuA domain-containing protein [Planctomycetes bacterium]|nr:ThuA domain-containing protein [Planctomycetota bacterium]